MNNFSSGRNLVLRGFTLVELLVALGIISLMTSVGFIAYESTRREAILRGSQRELASVIRLAQGYALQGKIQSAGGIEFTPCGYGVRFTNATTYHIFYTAASSGSTCEANDNYPGSEVRADNDFTLDDDVSITNTPANVKFYYVVPFGAILNSSGGSFGGITINLSHTGVTKSVTLNDRGDITEDN